MIAGSAPHLLQKNDPTRDAADKYLDETNEAHHLRRSTPTTCSMQ